MIEIFGNSLIIIRSDVGDVIYFIYIKFVRIIK